MCIVVIFIAIIVFTIIDTIMTYLLTFTFSLFLLLLLLYLVPFIIILLYYTLLGFPSKSCLTKSKVRYRKEGSSIRYLVNCFIGCYV